MPFGAPSHTVPKSGWRFRSPHDAISVDELGSTGDALMSVFHGLSAGNGRRPPRLAGSLFEPDPPGLFPDTPGSVVDSLAAAPHAMHHADEATNKNQRIPPTTPVESLPVTAA